MKKFTTKDLINAGVFSILILFTYFITGAVAHVPFLMPFIPFLASITAGIPYMLYTTKISRPGMISITMAMFMLLFVVSGHGLFVIPGAIIAAILAEMLIKKGNYSSIKYAKLSYIAFNIFSAFIFLPIFVARESLAAQLVGRGIDPEQVKMMFSYFPNYMFPIIIGLALIGATIGANIGSKILSKHFKRAGMI